MNFAQKQNKIKILQERANKWNNQEDHMIDQQGFEPEEAR